MELLVEYNSSVTSLITQDALIVWMNPNKNVEAEEVVVLAKVGETAHCLKAPYAAKIDFSDLKVGDVVSPGGAFFNLVKSSNSHDATSTDVNTLINEKIWDLAIAANATFKGLLGSMGQSGQIAKKTIPISVLLPVKNGIDALINSIGKSLVETDLKNGDVVVVAEKPYPVAQNRLIPFDLIRKADPKKLSQIDREKLLRDIGRYVDAPVSDESLILADTYIDDHDIGEKATVGAFDHNRLSYLTAQAIYQYTNKVVDVVISDTDTGVDVRKMIIGCITLGATPIGATKGLNLYECMRAACAAEFARGADKGIPIVICRPAFRCVDRDDTGDYRGYAGMLDYNKEGKKIAYA